MNFEKYVNKKRYPTMSMVPDKELRTEMRVTWTEEQESLYNQFKEDLAVELGLVGHPKWEDLFMLAWDEGHAEGFESVYEWAERLSVLLDKDDRPERVEKLRRLLSP